MFRVLIKGEGLSVEGVIKMTRRAVFVIRPLLLMAVLLPSIVLANTGERSLLESYNHAMFSFNDKADQWVFKPIAQGYHYVTPDFLERGVLRMFSNLAEVRNITNDLLQGKISQAGNDVGRLVVNSTVGLVGFFDVAEKLGLEKSLGEDFGQTLAVWGVGEGGYLVLPFLGPSTFRDAPGLIVDSFLDPIGEISHVPTRNESYGMKVISTRAELLEAEKLIKGDKYTFLKNIYLQRREYLVNDGVVEDDFGDDDDYY